MIGEIAHTYAHKHTPVQVKCNCGMNMWHVHYRVHYRDESGAVLWSLHDRTDLCFINCSGDKLLSVCNSVWCHRNYTKSWFLDLVFLKWFFGHPSTWQMRSHTTEKALHTVWFLLKTFKRSVKHSFCSSFCFSLSLRRSSAASRRDLEVSFRAVFAEAGGAQQQTSE